MGFPEKFKIVVSDTRAYKQFGNAVVVPVVKTIGAEMIKCLSREKAKSEDAVCTRARISRPSDLYATV